MAEATWHGDGADGPIDWRISAALENVPRGDGEVAEVTSLRGAVEAWLRLDDAGRAAAVLFTEQPINPGDAEPVTRLSGGAIGTLADRLPADEKGDHG